MQTIKQKRIAVVAIVLSSGILAVALLVRPSERSRESVALAQTLPGAARQVSQGQTAPAFQGFDPGQGPPGGPGQGPGMGPGGMPGRMPFVMGTVAEVDAKAGVIYVESPFGGEQTVKVSSTTKFISQTTAKAADIKVGDRIQVQGVPTGLTANSVTIGEMPDMFRMGPPGGGMRQGGGGRSQQPMRMGMGMAMGSVKALSPLTISVGDNVTVTVRLASDARLTKYVTTSLSAIKEDDRVMVAGSQGEDGVFNATTVAVNLGMPGMGGPGMGGPGMGGPGMGPGRAPGGQPPAGR